jgi:hypothetical protein
MLEIRLLKTTGDTIEDTEMGNRPGKAKLTSAEEPLAQLAAGPHFYPGGGGPCPSTRIGRARCTICL